MQGPSLYPQSLMCPDLVEPGGLGEQVRDRNIDAPRLSGRVDRDDHRFVAKLPRVYDHSALSEQEAEIAAPQRGALGSKRDHSLKVVEQRVIPRLATIPGERAPIQ